MRILQVIHQFPPFSSQGSEVYCHALASRLRATDDVRVFHISNTPHRRPWRLDRGEANGVPTYHCVDGGEYARLADWPNALLRDRFGAVLDECRPEVVHFHNYLSLGDDLVSVARQHGAVVVYTLHDFGLICPNTLLLRTDGQLCEKADPNFFQDCCPLWIRTAGGGPPALAARVPSLWRWRLYASQQRHAVLRGVLGAAVSAAEWWWGPPSADVDRKRAFFLEHTSRLISDVHLFLAPSEFLRRRMVACGVPPEKIAYLRNGIRHFPREAARAPSTGTSPIVLGYLGALHAHKGVEILLEAFEGLDDRARLHVHGSTFGSPVSESHWRRISSGGGRGVVFRGAYENGDLARILASLDALVVPSVWYENAPLTIQEAFVAGVPVVTGDQGGMAELVRDGIDGLHFRIGDAVDLRRTLRRLIDEPGLLERLRRNIPAVPDIDAQAAQVRARYAALLS